jgi:hypothetical protein
MTNINLGAIYRFKWLSLPLLPAMVFLLAACGSTNEATSTPGPASTTITEPTSKSTPATSHGGPVVDQVSFIDALRKAGFTVTPGSTMTQPFLSVGGQTLVVNTESVQIYEYADEAAATKDASKIQPDATIAGTSVMWVAQPHFYRAGKLIVLYVGTNATLLTGLDAVLGKPFAVGPNISGPGVPTVPNATAMPTP